MSGLPDITEATRMMMDAYAQGLATMTKALEQLGRQGPEARQAAEQWLRLARTAKEGAIAAIEQGFQLWEREMRRLLDAAHGPSAGPAPNPMEAWAETWRKGVEEMMATATKGSAGAPGAAATIQKSFQESLLAWQRLWQPPEKK